MDEAKLLDSQYASLDTIALKHELIVGSVVGNIPNEELLIRLFCRIFWPLFVP